MTRVRLEFDQVQIYRPKERWNLYFVVMAEHPSDPEKMVVTTLPQEPFKLSKRHENAFQFDTGDEGAEGLFVLSREIPANQELNVHVYLKHSRKTVRDLGEVFQNIEEGLGDDSYGVASDLLGTTSTQWLVIAKKAIPEVGKILAKIPDRDFGFLSAFERFGSEFETQHEVDRKKDFSGDASLVYSWSVDA
ncbi:MAG TPA: hypothetical protein VK151_00305 [Fluviicola sp.]|nr:hypothetical protein [Fluviicola sp.]